MSLLRKHSDGGFDHFPQRAVATELDEEIRDLHRRMAMRKEKDQARGRSAGTPFAKSALEVADAYGCGGSASVLARLGTHVHHRVAGECALRPHSMLRKAPLPPPSSRCSPSLLQSVGKPPRVFSVLCPPFCFVTVSSCHPSAIVCLPRLPNARPDGRWS